MRSGGPARDVQAGKHRGSCSAGILHTLAPIPELPGQGREQGRCTRSPEQGSGLARFSWGQSKVPCPCLRLAGCEPSNASTALLLLLSSLHCVRGSTEPAPTTACPGDKSSPTDGSNTWKDRLSKFTKTPRRQLMLHTFLLFLIQKVFQHICYEDQLII